MKLNNQTIKVDTRDSIRQKARELGRKIPSVPADLPEPSLSENPQQTKSP